MVSKIWHAKFLHLLLGVVFLGGMLPISMQTASMPMMDMNTAASPVIKVQAATSHNSMGTCCEALGAFLLCDFVSFASADLNPSGGTEKIAYADLVVKLIYIEALAPPPKA